MSDENNDSPREVKIVSTEQSKELTDKIHRLVRSFSRQLVNLVSEEIGARAPKIKGKPGPKKGFKMPLGLCPVCRLNENSRRRFGFICKDCSAGKPIGFRTKMREHFREHRVKKLDRLGKHYQVKAKIPKHLPVQPSEVPVEALPDVEPSFLDELPVVEVVDTPEAPEAAPPPVSGDEWQEWFK